MTEPMWGLLIFTVVVTAWALIAEEMQLRSRARDRREEWLPPATQQRTWGRHW